MSLNIHAKSFVPPGSQSVEGNCESSTSVQPEGQVNNAWSSLQSATASPSAARHTNNIAGGQKKFKNNPDKVWSNTQKSNDEPKKGNFNLALSAKTFVGQLPFECTEERLNELFSAYGHVISIHIIRDHHGNSKGAAFVTFSSVEEADTAIFTLHNRYRMLTNRTIQISYAKNSPNMSPFGQYSAMEVHQQNRSNPIPDLC